MRHYYLLLIALICFSTRANAQTQQLSFGSNSNTISFNALKYDPTDGSTINVGSVNNAATGNDCFIAKINAQNQIVWQKSITNIGSDGFNQVIVCANGDYIALGNITLAGVITGYVTRMTNTGTILWQRTSPLIGNPLGDRFYNLCETTAGNIAVVGTTNFAPGLTDGIYLLYNNGGNLLWAKKSTSTSSDELFAVNQMSAGRLIMTGFYSLGSNYNMLINEVDEATGNVLSMNSYAINTNVPGYGVTINSLFPLQIFINNGSIDITASVFEGFASESFQYVFNYNPTTKAVSGGIYYHPGQVNHNGLVLYQIAANDFIMSQNFQSPNVVYLTRVTNGVTVFDKKVQGVAKGLYGLDGYNGTLAFAGSTTSANAFAMFSTNNLADITNCGGVDVTNLTKIPITQTPVGTNIFPYTSISSGPLVNFSSLSTTFVLSALCGCTSTTIAIQPANVSLCNTGNATFSVSTANATNFQWQLNTGSGWNNLNNNATYSGTNTATLTVTGANTSMNNYVYRCIVANSCSNVTSNPATLIVNTPITPAVSINASANNICGNTSVTFTATAVNGGTAPVYQWQKNSINVGTNSNTYTSNTLVNGDVIKCIVTTNAPCFTSSTATSNSITMVVTTPLTPSASIAASANNICSGTAVTFTAAAVNGGGAPTYQWKRNNSNVGTNTNTYTDNALANGDLIQCVVTSSLTCVTSATAASNIITMNVTTTVTPAVSIAASASSICTGTNVTFTATAANGGTTPAYQWKKNNVNVGTNSNTYSDNTLVNADVISCSIISNFNCVTTANANSNNITITVNPPVTPSVTISTPSNTICAGNAVTFVATPINGGTLPVYQWKVNGANVGTNSNSFTSTTLINGAMVTCELTSNAPCATVSKVLSNSITMTVLVSGISNTRYPAVSTFYNEPVTLQARQIDGATYTWSPALGLNSTSISNPVFTYTQDKDYLIKIKLSNGCTITDSLLVKVIKETGIYVPTAFSPQGSNKTLYPFLVGIKQLKYFRIYNRWGNVLFQTADAAPAKGWNGIYQGRLQPTETYTWVAEGIDIFGKTIKKGGNTLLIR